MWLNKADQFIEFNAYQALTDSGRITMQQAKALAEERYAIYDAQRRVPEENRLARKICCGSRRLNDKYSRIDSALARAASTNLSYPLRLRLNRRSPERGSPGEGAPLNHAGAPVSGSKICAPPGRGGPVVWGVRGADVGLSWGCGVKMGSECASLHITARHRSLAIPTGQRHESKKNTP
ncbi:hypothetical protein [Corynebacterium mastitidis]|uniref:hypothetical protein n=1 Tax=Corynebacterium mastitidis TaxID=161890 RepID=UPI001B7FEECB|nr:hypothetical protein [Corynebacterium mastitidis]